MAKTKIALRCAFWFLFLLTTSLLTAEEGRITDIRFWQSPEEAQIVFDLSWNPRVTPIETLPDGTLFFDIESCAFKPGRQTYSLNNAFLNVLTVQERSNGATRVFFRIPDGVRQKTFFLPKNSSKPDRIVVFLSESAAKLEQRRADELNEINRLKANNVKIVVIDPGHGGEDPGARHSGIVEKDYVLEFGKLLKSFFDRDPGYRAVLTRTGDYIIPLVRRSQIAEHLGADVFVSIHVNYNKKRAIRGIEVYYESYRGAVGQAESLVAESENQQDMIGGADVGSYWGYTKAKQKTDILQKQASVMFKSSQLADRVEKRLNYAVPGLFSRGVKRAGFKVLHSTNLPSILVELGYTSNPTDAAFLKHGPSQQRLANAIYWGIKDFLDSGVKEGIDANYLTYVQEIEAAKRAKAEKLRIARERREKALRESKPYTVKAGETIAKIASRFNVKLSKLCELNQMSKNQKLKAGQVIRIPAG